MKHKYIVLKSVSPIKYDRAYYAANAAAHAYYAANAAAHAAHATHLAIIGSATVYAAYEPLKKSIAKTGFSSVFKTLLLSLTSLE